jgi:hypothetical protein
VCISYGDKPADEWLFLYGFLPPCKPTHCGAEEARDVATVELPLEEADPAVQARAELLYAVSERVPPPPPTAPTLAKLKGARLTRKVKRRS